MVVKKINGFTAPYRSQTFQKQADGIVQTSGLLVMEDEISTVSGDVVVPPFSFIQNGLIVEVSDERVVPEPSLSAPYYLTASALTSNDIDDLALTFAKSPTDISSSQVIIGLWDGVEWRSPKKVSIKEIHRDILQANIDFDRVGPFSGLKTTYAGGLFVVDSGVIVDRTGERHRLDDQISFSPITEDPDFYRVDRIIYRRPIDDENRIGGRRYITGGTHDTSISSVNQTSYSSSGVHSKQKIIILQDNSAVLLYAQGYGESYSLKFVRYNAERTVELVSETILASDMAYGEWFDASLDSSGNIHVVYPKTDGSIYAQSFNGITGLTDVAEAMSMTPASGKFEEVSCTYSTDLDRLFIASKLNLGGASNNQIWFKSFSASSHAENTAPKRLDLSLSSLAQPSIFISKDFYVYVAFQESFTKKIGLRKFNDIGEPLEALQYLSENTSYGVTTLTDVAKDPRVIVTDNREVFVTFLQDKGGSAYGMAFWKDGSASIIDLASPTESFLRYDVAWDDFLNGLHVSTTRTGSITDYTKVVNNEVIFTYEVSSSSGIYSAISLDRWGSALHSWSAVPSGTFTVYSSGNSVLFAGAVGPQTGLYGDTIDPSPQQIVVPSTVTPLIGQRVTLSTSGGGNNGDYIITGISSGNYDALNDVYLLTLDSSLSPETVILADYAEPDADSVSFAKTNTELTARAYSYEVLESDILLARIVWPGPTILSYAESGIGPINPDTARLVVYGNPVTLDWGATAPGNITVVGNLKVSDLVNAFDYTLTNGSFPMVEGQALYVTLDGTDMTPTPQVTDITTLDFSEPIEILGVIKSGRFVPHFLLNGVGLGILDDGEVSTIGEEPPDILRARLGILSDTQFQQYDNSNIFLLTDNYPTALSKLDAAIKAIQDDTGGLDVIDVAADGSVFTAPNLIWNGDQASTDIIVFVNGKYQVQDTAGGLDTDFRKTSVNSLEFSYDIRAGQQLVIYKVKTGGGAEGSFSVEVNGTPIAPAAQILNFLGTGWSVTDAGGGRININFAGGGGSGVANTKIYRNTSGSLITAGSALAFDNDGGIVLADANISDLSDFAGIAVSDIAAGSYGPAYKFGEVPGILNTLGANPGQIVYLGENPGELSLSIPLGAGDTILSLGQAEVPDSADPLSTSATSLYLFPRLISGG